MSACSGSSFLRARERPTCRVFDFRLHRPPTGAAARHTHTSCSIAHDGTDSRAKAQHPHTPPSTTRGGTARGNSRSAWRDGLASDHLALAAEMGRHTPLAAEPIPLRQTTHPHTSGGKSSHTCTNTRIESRAPRGTLLDTGGVGPSKDAQESVAAHNPANRQGDTWRSAETYHQAHSS